MGHRLARGLRRLGVGTLAVATICATFPPPRALAAPSPLLLAQAYPAPPGEPAPPAEPPPEAQWGSPAEPPKPAPDADYDEGGVEGRNDALARPGTGWFLAGFFLNLLGVILGYAVTPRPDATRLVGRSPAYARGYLRSYRVTGRRNQGLHALLGCVTASLLAALVVLYVLAETTPACTGC